MRRSILAVCSLLLAGCLNLDVPAPENNPSNPTTETFAAGLNIDIASMQKTTSGVFYKDVTVGSGAALTSKRPVIIDYNAYLRNGARIDFGTNAPIDLSVAITGFGDGMLGMKEGGERWLVIPSALAYGNSNNIPEIPPNSTLVFDIRLDQIP
ncbi:MAG TPA: FKBP-type peptidyl-prolyl cis-trans isomerase [Gemmatimonadaceae bacterium]